MAFEPFGLVGGVTVGIPPILVIDGNGNVTSNRGNIANLSTAVINSSVTITGCKTVLLQPYSSRS